MSVEYWIWLQKVLGYCNETVSRVISDYGTAENFYHASDSERIVRCRLNKFQAERLHKISRKEVFGVINLCAKCGINILTPEDTLYPERLLSIFDMPAVLYVKGDRFDFNNNPTVAIVGPRKVSDYGLNCAFVIANTLASCGFTVVSGCAVGGDSAVHRGAIEADGYTVGVLGCGIESDYLMVNAELRKAITKKGCLVSEYPPDMGVTRGAFPKRNRIISGLSNAVVVIEGSTESGTLITARHAAEQGRDVYVIPGSPTLPQYEGSNRLIADGARPLLNVNEIINEYLHLYPDKIHSPKNIVSVYRKDAYKSGQHEVKEKEAVTVPNNDNERVAAKPDKGVLSGEAIEVLRVFEQLTESFNADDAIDKLDFDAGTVLGAVTELEICGFIEAVVGGKYRLKY